MSEQAILKAIDKAFTFHNVSINSTVEEYKKKHKLNLHSIMYLLIRIVKIMSSPAYQFTFHNVSINSHRR